MNSYISSKLEAKLLNLIYRYKFIFIYTIIGILSILLELLVRYNLMKIGFPVLISSILSIIAGILFAFYANIKINFKVPKLKIKRALIYFTSISLLSASIQYLIKLKLLDGALSYEVGRVSISGVVFVIAYYFHRKYTFADFKKVGVAIYANGTENLSQIHRSIGQLPDFIHVDIIDHTMNNNPSEVQTYRLETVRAFWPDIEIQTQIMSKKPSLWIDQVIGYSDVVYLHVESNENLFDLVNRIKRLGKKAGIALTLESNIEDYLDLLEEVDCILLLTIENPGFSGQKFSDQGIESIEKINSLLIRNKLLLCVDGGINTQNINNINAEYVVSGSAVLKSTNPMRVIMHLQTVGRYEIN